MEGISSTEMISLSALSYLLIINLIAFIAFAADKKRSERGAWRIPEKHLLLLATIGGSPMIWIARKLLRHKTQKQPFVIFLLLIIIVQCLLAGGILYWFVS